MDDPVGATRVLLVEDDEDDYVLTRALLQEADGGSFVLEWVESCDAGVKALAERRFDVVLLDYRVGKNTGIDFLREIPDLGRAPPVILLTGQADRETDLEAMRSGAVDFLVKGTLTPTSLERAIRYAVGRRAADLQAREAEAGYRRLVESVGAIVWQADPETLRFTLVSNEAEALLGYPIQNWVDDANFWADHLHPDDRAEAVRFCREAAERSEPHTLEYRMMAADGRVVWLRDTVRVVGSGTDRVLAGVMIDISEARAAEEGLLLSNRAIAAISEGVVLTDAGQPGNPIISVNRAFTRITGYTRADVIGRNCRFLQGPATDAADVARIRTAVDNAEPVTVEVVNYRKDGTPFWNRLSINPVYSDTGAVTHFAGIQQDVTAQREAAAQLEAAEAHYRRLVESSPYGIFALDVNGKPTEVNPAMAALLGRPAEALLRVHFLDVIAPEDRDKAQQAFTAKVEGRVPETDFQAWISRPSGEQRLLHMRSVGIVENGVVQGTHGVARDITEERRADRQRRMLATALDGLADDGISIFNPDDGFLYTNAAHARISGYDPATPTKALADLLHGDSQETIPEIIEHVRHHGSWAGRVQRRRSSDGTLVPLDMIVGGVEDEGRELFFTVIRDATQTVAREQQLRRAERLASVGTLLSGVAHELNNPLHAIAGFASLLLMDVRSEEDLEALTMIKRESERAARIVSNLRVVARQTQEQTQERGPVDLNEAIEHVLKLRRYVLETAGITTETHLERDLPPVHADRTQMEQVILNLVVNAEQALLACEGERRLTLRTCRDGIGVSLRVIDSGPGIAEEHLAHLFDPFFTTKTLGEGIGLGLSLVHSIVTEHGGGIHVESTLGHGATFQIDLPATVAEAAPEQPPAVGAPNRPLRVLVVDDEPAIRRAISRFLARRGHTAHEATGGEEALHLLAERPADEPIDVILCDFRMPRLSGPELLKRLRQQDVGYARKFIFLTGDTGGSEDLMGAEDSDIPILYKPLDLVTLVQAVEERAGHAGS